MRTHRMRGRFVLAGLALAVSITVASPACAAESDKTKAARELLALWAGGKHKEFVERSDETMKKAFDETKVSQAWASVEFQYGKYISERSAEEIPAGELTAVRLTLNFERAVLKIRFVLTKDNRLTGLFFDAVEPIDDGRVPPYVQKGRLGEEKLTLTCGKFDLPAILTLPASNTSKLPVVVLIHGSGPHDADETIGPNKPFRDLAWGLAMRGVASLRYEKRTHKYKSDIKAEDITLEWETIDDACAAAQLLRDRPEIDPQRIFAIGHSLGGAAAPFVAARDGKLAGIVLMAATARPLTDVIEDQLTYIFNLDGAVSPQEQAELDKARPAIAALRAGKPMEAKESLLGAPNTYWMDVLRHDNFAATQKLDMPILILHGGRDYQVTMKEFDIWKSKLGGKKSVTLRLFDSLNHLMIAGTGRSSPEEYQKAGFVEEAVITAIADWINVAADPRVGRSR